MKKRQIVLPLVAGAFLLLPVRVSAQDDYALFRERAEGASLLYRGHKAFTYDMLFNGTFYWAAPEFRTGEVFYNGKAYRDVLLNVDAVRQDLIVKHPAGIVDKVLARDCVERFRIGDERFVNLQAIYGADAPSGYWQVLYDGRGKLLKQVRKRLEQDVETRKREQTGYDPDKFRYNVYQVFTMSSALCYVTESGEIIPVRRRSDLLKRIENPTRREARRHALRLGDGGIVPLDIFCTDVLNYVESR